ncbi:hypothetical protein [Pseudonocardia alni]|uniref:Uncharacterized protein n=1 Tax=Pseudonocardia alni TaxID=33907 RepID=A0A852W293_PSEA5|nr:hypothetical protein [Pseudonocardia antarctica]NYG02789.1 hypothetical protein [Pseudonocardia antarctica]
MLGLGALLRPVSFDRRTLATTCPREADAGDDRGPAGRRRRRPGAAGRRDPGDGAGDADRVPAVAAPEGGLLVLGYAAHLTWLVLTRV